MPDESDEIDWVPGEPDSPAGRAEADRLFHEHEVAAGRAAPAPITARILPFNTPPISHEQARDILGDEALADDAIASIPDLHQRWLDDPRFHALVALILDVRDTVHRAGHLPSEDALRLAARAELIVRPAPPKPHSDDVLYAEPARPANPAIALALLHGHPGQTCTGFNHAEVRVDLVEDAALRGLTAEPLTTGRFARVHGRDLPLGETEIVKATIPVRLTRVAPDTTEPKDA